MKSQSHIELPHDLIAAFCRRHHITRLSLFGSVLRDDFRPESDIDILVEFDPQHIPGLLRVAAMENELSDMLQRKVDLRTAEDLSRHFRQDVLKGAELQYAA
jgi:predicted nucleotidyltransferase